MTYVRVDRMDDGSFAVDTSEGMSRDDAVFILEMGKNELQISPPTEEETDGPIKLITEADLN